MTRSHVLHEGCHYLICLTMGDILAVIVPGRTVAIGKQSPLTIKDRLVIEDRSPARILLLGSIHNAIIDMQGIHDTPQQRSEEHTSELQSHLNLVCRLLLEKKKNNQAHQLE